MELKGVIKSNFFNNLPKKLSTKEGVMGATRNYQYIYIAIYPHSPLNEASKNDNPAIGI